ncbi:MAG: hypothetical protein Q4D33_06410 [Prevotellaceae bacterium]|nr:hypothetical protein [Prevotellaceae bacterium]
MVIAGSPCQAFSTDKKLPFWNEKRPFGTGLAVFWNAFGMDKTTIKTLYFNSLSKDNYILFQNIPEIIPLNSKYRNTDFLIFRSNIFAPLGLEFWN